MRNDSRARRWFGRTFVGGITAVVVASGLVATPVRGAPGDPVPGTDITYTTDADFDKGLLVNVNHDAPNGNQLQLNTSSGTFPFIWIALSARGTIAKIDTATGTVLGEYSTTPDNDSSHNPSRTTVGLDGSAWAGNRNQSSVIHVGLVETNSCVDRDQSGTIETSSGYGDVKPWASGGVENAQDECILHYVDTQGSDARHVSVTAGNDVWVGSTGTHHFQRIDGETGTVDVAAVQHPCGGYGGLVDGNGIVWSADYTGTGSLLRWDPTQPTSETNPRCIPSSTFGWRPYGMALAADGFVWTTSGFDGVGKVAKISADGTTTTQYSMGTSNSQGLAVDGNGHIWTSASTGGGTQVSHIHPDGTLLGTVAVGAGSTGVAVDAAGNIWTANLDASNATRINPNAGPFSTATGHETERVGEADLTVSLPGANPYNYSDMTGAVLLNSTAPQGTWTVVQDAGTAGFAWTTVILNTEDQAFVPEGASISVAIEARAADSPAGLGSETFKGVEDCGVAGVVGRYIQVRITLLPNDQGESPVLSDVRIKGGPAPTQAECLGEEDAPPLRPPNYSLVNSNGDVFAFAAGSSTKLGRQFSADSLPIVGGAADPDGTGHWVVAADGGVYQVRPGDIGFFGSMGGARLNSPIVGMAASPDGRGYWLFAADGGVFAFGSARFFGSMGGVRLNSPIVGGAATPSGKGYYLVGADGGIFAFGDAVFRGSMGGKRLNRPIVGMAADRDGDGYYLVALDGGVFAFAAVFHGSLVGVGLVAPIAGLATDPDGSGYWMGGRDGGVFAFNADFFGSAVGQMAPGVGVAITSR